MRKGETFDKWTLNHLEEMISTYLSERYPENAFILQTNGNLVNYEIWPRWYARMRNRVNTVYLRDIIREIWQIIEENGVDDPDFAKMFIYNQCKDLIDVTYYLHIIKGISSESDKESTGRTTFSKQVSAYNSSGIVNTEKVDEYNIRLTDGLYNVQQYLVNRLRGSEPSVQEIIDHINKY